MPEVLVKTLSGYKNRRDCKGMKSWARDEIYLDTLSAVANWAIKGNGQ